MSAVQTMSKNTIPPQASGSAPRVSPVLARLVMRYSTLAVIVLLFCGFAVFVENFFSLQNIVNILQQISMLTIVGVGLTFTFVTKEIDLSVGFTAGLAGLVAALLMVSGWSMATAMLVGLAIGLTVGVVNALLVTVVGIPSLIATLAMGSILFGLNLLVTGGRAIYGGLPEAFLFLGQGSSLGLPNVSWIMLLLVFAAWFTVERTLLGRYLYAVGGNARAAELSGIHVRRFRILGMVICALFASAAGVLLTARLGSGQPNAGERYLLDGLATVFIGMTMIRPGTATVIGTLFGALFIGVVNNGLNLMGLDSNIQNIVKGAIIIVAVSVISRTTKLKLL